MTGTADQGFGALPFGEIARATVAAQERSLELAQAWAEALRLLEAAVPGAQPRRPARDD
jgi:hypothetical protein